MNPRRILVTALLMFPVVCPAASREIQEIMRDVAQIQEQLRNMQQSQNEKMAAIQVLVQQALDAANKTNTSVAVLDSSIRSTLREQENKVVAPVVGVGAKMDQVSTDVSALRDAVADLQARSGKLQQQLVDLSNAVRTMQAPAPPPPGPDGATAAPGAMGAASTPPAGVLYENARRDRLGGKNDIALQEFQDYLKFYGNTDLAPNAQFYIGDIYLSQGKLEDAIKAFDAVLERYPDNNKTPDALYMKGQTLVKMGQRTKGAQEFRELIRRFPSNSLAAKARAQLRALGLSAGARTTHHRR